MLCIFEICGLQLVHDVHLYRIRTVGEKAYVSRAVEQVNAEFTDTNSAGRAEATIKQNHFLFLLWLFVFVQKHIKFQTG